MRILHLFLVGCLLWLPTAISAEPLAVITAANSPLNTLHLEMLKLIYLRKTQIDADGNRWIPLNLPVSDGLRRGFSQALFGVLPEEQDEYWNEQYFNGIVPPKVLASEEAVLRFVAATTGAIGYVGQSKVDNRVKVLLTVNSK